MDGAENPSLLAVSPLLPPAVKEKQPGWVEGNWLEVTVSTPCWFFMLKLLQPRISSVIFSGRAWYTDFYNIYWARSNCLAAAWFLWRCSFTQRQLTIKTQGIYLWWGWVLLWCNINSIMVSPSCLCFPFVNEQLNWIKCLANVLLIPANEHSALFSERSSKWAADFVGTSDTTGGLIEALILLLFCRYENAVHWHFAGIGIPHRVLITSDKSVRRTF